MELYTLNLHKTLEYENTNSTALSSWEAITAFINTLKEGDECLCEFAESDLTYTDENGPHAVSPLPLPCSFGTSRQTGQTPAGNSIRLPPAAYLFTQHQWNGPESIYEAIDWFIRESWWQRETSEGPYYIRFVQEDGKTALQVLRRKHQL